ncbi:MAG: SLBB domain-containing protein [Steroidobacteraceae bacterium]
MAGKQFRLSGCVIGAVFAVVAIMGSGLASAQVSASDAMSIYNSLSSDQQQAILQRLTNGQTTLGTTTGTTQRSTTSLNNPAAPERMQLPGQQQQLQQQDMLQGPSKLKPGDTVLVALTIHTIPDTSQQAGDNDQNSSQSGTDASSGVASTSAAAAASTQRGTSGQQSNPYSALSQLRTTSQAVGQAASGTATTAMGMPVVLSALDQAKANAMIELIRLRNPYVLDRNGALLLPGFAPIQLAGLTEDQASQRISADPAIVNLDAKLTLLPLDKTGADALMPFGYDLFYGMPTTFAPTTDVPVPADYVVGAGDVFAVQLYGSQNQTMTLTVGRDGTINFPQLGPISVAGRRFNEVRADIQQRVSRQMIGVNASLSMSDVRSIQIFVLGEAQTPGVYTVSGLATITSALYASGGVKTVGSLRNIQLRRQGTLVRTLDLYDLLLRGDTANDVKLLPGDVVFIPPVGPTVSADGEVQRSAIYELKGNETLADLLGMAGGLTSEADASLGSLTRVDAQRRRVVIGTDLSNAAATTLALRNGDALRVARLRPTLDSGVVLQGDVFRPGNYAWHQGMRLSEVLQSVDELKPDADQHYVLIRRESDPGRQISVLSADLAAALRAPGSAADVPLQPRDQLTIFDQSSDRARILTPLMAELDGQSSLSEPTQKVTVNGRVKLPGDYPLETGMRVADLVRAGGSLDSAAYGGKAELSRYVLDGDQVRRGEVLSIDLAAALRGDPAANLALQPFDGLYIKEISGWTEQQQITLKGEVRFPGVYAIQPGETLRSVVARAGGLTEYASADGAVFTRLDLQQKEQDQLNRLADRMQSDLAAVSLMAARANQSGGAQQAYAVGQSLIKQLKSTQAVGRLVIDLSAAMNASPNSADDIILRDGDLLVVPKRSQEVTVMGEVQTVTSHLYRANLSRDDYVNISGGLTRQADRKHIYVVRADGSVIANSDRWFSGAGEMKPGDTIVAPLNTDRLPTLPLWQSVTQIIYNLAIAAAAVNSF